MSVILDKQIKGIGHLTTGFPCQQKPHTHTRTHTPYVYIVQTPVLSVCAAASIPFLFSIFHSLSLYFRLTRPSLIAIASFVSFALFSYLFFLFRHTPKHPIFRAIRISRLLLSVHYNIVFGPVYLPIYLSIFYLFHPLPASPTLSVFPGGVHTPPPRVFTRYKRKLFNLQHSADFEDKQLEIGKRNKTRQFDNNDYFITPCARMWWCLCGTRDCAWALNVKRMTHI